MGNLYENLDIRLAIDQNGLLHKDVAKKLDVDRCTLSRQLAKPLRPMQRERILAAIETLLNERKDEDGKKVLNRIEEAPTIESKQKAWKRIGKRNDSFVLYGDTLANLDMLSDEDAGRLFRNIAAYSRGDPAPCELSSGALMLFNIICQQIERDRKKYNDMCEKHRAIANKRWEKQWEKQKKQWEKQKNSNDTAVFSAIDEVMEAES